jgi:hypothetical protein
MLQKATFTLILTLCIISFSTAREPMLLVRIQLDNPEDIIFLEDMHLDFASLAVTDHADVVVTQDELAEIQRRGFRTEIIQREDEVFVPDEYHTVDETWAVLDSLHQLYPDITELDTCGYSQRFNMPIARFTISSTVGVREDEPAALINGMHHAREPIGNEICLHTIKWILYNYPDSTNAQKWVDSMELQFVPIVNPEGWQYITDSSLNYPWWRKNLRDNGNNGGPINPDSDGVDLNRNYDWRWILGGDPNPTSWVYRGPYPHSESEIQALTSLAAQRKFVVGISYHSYGYDVFRPWYYNGIYTPDESTMTEIAHNIAYQIGDYTPGHLGGTNMSSVWLYGELGMYDFLIETALSFIPPPDTIVIECEKNFNGIVYLLNRTFYSGITGHVLDSTTLAPLTATVEVLGLVGDTITPRTSDSLHGRFYRLLTNGTYTMRFSRPGYITKTVTDIPVTSDSLTKLEVLLATDVGIEQGEIAQLSASNLGAWPNPFTKGTDIKYQIQPPGETGEPGHGMQDIALHIYNTAGRLVRVLHSVPNALHPIVFSWDGKDDAGRRLASGIYFYRLAGTLDEKFGKVVMMR